MEAWKHTFYLGIYKYVELVMQPAGIRRFYLLLWAFLFCPKSQEEKQKLTGKGGIQDGKSRCKGIFI
jgi:hypothetical protein